MTTQAYRKQQVMYIDPLEVRELRSALGHALEEN
jgi:hypothetical protein